MKISLLLLVVVMITQMCWGYSPVGVKCTRATSMVSNLGYKNRAVAQLPSASIIKTGNCLSDTHNLALPTKSKMGSLASLERGAMPYALQVPNIKIFPNPTEGDLTIEFDDSTQDEKIEIVDMLGVKVYEANYHKHINISSFIRGVYFLKLLDKNNRLIIMERVVKK